MALKLETIRKNAGVSLVDMADELGIKYQTVSEKIDGRSSFKFDEALKIQEKFFPEYNIKYLFTPEESDEKKT